MPNILFAAGNFIVINTDGVNNVKPRVDWDFIEDSNSFILAHKFNIEEPIRILKSDSGDWENNSAVAYTEETLRSFLQTETRPLINPSGVLVLDNYPDATAAYSLRRLSSSYEGSAIRVRRSFDDTEQDIGFVNNELDTEGLLAFTGAGDAFVTTWYDQSGNSYDALQATTIRQPKIVDTGILQQTKSKPSILFDGTDDSLQSTSFTTISQPLTKIVVNDFVEVSGTRYVVEGSDTKRSVFGGKGDGGYRLFSGSINDYNTIPILNTQYVHYALYNGADSYLRYNQTQLANVSIGTGGIDRNTIGRSATGETNYFSGNLQEYILWGSDQESNKLGIESNINSHYNIYWDGTQTSTLDTYSGASAAYSLRALNSAYTGPLIRVRRSSDSKEQDIYALYDGTLDTETLETFVGANDGFVVTRYDQSGNGYDLTQATTTKQPKIVNAGALYKFNDEPYILYDGVDDALVSSTNPIFGTDSRSIFLVQKTNSVGFADARFNLSSGSGNGVGWNITPEIGTRTNSITWVSSTPTSTTKPSLISNVYTSGDLHAGNSMWLDGVSVTRTSGTDGAINTADNNMVEGSANGSSFFFDGYISESIIYKSDQTANRVNIEREINSVYQMYWDGTKTGLLDTYPDATAAYSLRALSSNYTGPLVKVRRASDNAETDIFADYNGNLDTTALEAFCAATDGFVSVWYDQSGNELNATAALTAREPQLVTSGVTNELNGNPNIVADNTDNLDIATNSLLQEAEMSIFATISRPDLNTSILLSDATTNAYVGYSGSSTANSYILASAPTMYDNGVLLPLNSREEFQNALISQSIISGFYDFTTSDTTLKLGYSDAIPMPNAQEIIIYNSDQSANRAGIEQAINSNYQVYWDGTSSGILDTYSGASAAYSLRALSSTYTGPMVRVRRASDNEEADIYATYAGDLDTTSLEAFCSGTNGFVTTWYDQSGNGTNTTQTTSGDQPQIVSSGSVITENSLPTIEFNGSEWLENIGVEILSGENFFTTSVSSNYTPDNVATIFCSTNADRWNRVSGFNTTLNSSKSAMIIDYRDSGADTNVYVLENLSKLNANTLYNISQQRFPTEAKPYVNSTIQSTNSSVTGTKPLDRLFIGVQSAGGTNRITYLTGNISEIILYDSNQSANRTAIESNINTYYNIYWDGSQEGLLDEHPDASAAYSLRALNSLYTGPLVRVRRSSDNEEQDIRALYDGSLDEEGLLGFVGTGGTDNGFIVTWYDQSGNSENVTQSTVTLQPKIVSSGVLNSKNSNPAILFDGVNDYLEAPSALSVFDTNEFSIFSVSSNSGTSIISSVLATSTTNNTGLRVFHDSRSSPNRNFYIYDGAIIAADLSIARTNSNQFLLSSFADNSGNVSAFDNGSAGGTDSGFTDGFNVNTTFRISNTFVPMDGEIQEIIIYSSDESFNRPSIEENINNQYNIY